MASSPRGPGGSLAHPRADHEQPHPTVDIGTLRALQRERLRWTVRHADDTVQHYRAAFDTAGLTPDDLRENYPFGMFAVPREQVRRIHASSVTTGRRPSSATPGMVGVTITATVVEPYALERSLGKARRILDERNLQDH